MGKRVSKVPRPACQEHPTGHVVLDGYYGPPDHRRPRYRCCKDGVGGAGREWHRFTEVMPRQVTDYGFCVRCERGLHRHEGPQTPRRYDFAARYIAEALVAVGRGESYRRAAAAARYQASRFPRSGDDSFRFSNHGQVVAEWVEVLAPVVFEQHRKTHWPGQGSVLLDHIGFRVKAVKKDGKPVTGPVAFNVLAAAGYENEVLRLWHLQSSPTVLTEDWHRFLSQTSGEPERVVTDGHSGTIRAAAKLWPGAEHWRSEWHLYDALYDYLRKAGLHGDSVVVPTLRDRHIRSSRAPLPSCVSLSPSKLKPNCL